MKFSIIAVALFAAILGQAMPITDSSSADSTYIGTETPAAVVLSNQDAAGASPMYSESADLANHDDLAGSVCPPGLKVAGFARLADYTVYGSDFDGAALASRYANGFFDNFGGPIIARALAKSDALPGKSEVFVQAQNANYFWHKSGTVAQVIGGLSPNRDYATYVAGGCSQFTGDVLAKCCH
ncbi:hypothetical protein QFC22_001806 [Naganishia vaughanmartiniae]|uniref:Uncharacterized protein n=1 Tax=Naganishia vaughanmartiniae TaxID=1424756 RepID=A0ACC2XG67_9TREE|nr:hypothetical protein QFC22_001806 [Naganishia vaughanmartiniae]